MTSDFSYLAINQYLQPRMDPTWRSRIESAFPYPYITRQEASAGTYEYTGDDIDKARQENIDAADAERQQIIKNVPLLDAIGAMTILGTHAAVDSAQQAKELIVIEDHGQWLYPAFQFSKETLRPFAVIKDLNARFTGKEINHWGELLWWVTKNPHLNDESPAHLLQSGREADLRAALLTED